MDDLDAAGPHVARAVEIERRRAGDAGRPVALLLLARVRLYRGDEADARALFERIQGGQRSAADAGRADALLVPSEEVLCAMIDLATRDLAASGAALGAHEVAWDDLEERSARFSVGQEQIEVLEVRAIAALRRGRLGEARGALERALAAAERIPNVMAGRLARWSRAIEQAEAARRGQPRAPSRLGCAHDGERQGLEADPKEIRKPC
jgi:Tfp pilus assembly protein PilF